MRTANLSARGEKNLLLAAGGIALVLWFLPAPYRLVLMPLVYLNTHIHELCHALAAVATGGMVAQIQVYANGSGMTQTAGGWFGVISSSGYAGASLFGAVMVVMAATQKGARIALVAMGLLVALGLIFWVRGDLIGVLSGVLWIGTLFGLAALVKGQWLIFWAQFLGLTQCLSAAQSLSDLVFISRIPGAHSDAHNMQMITGLPPLFWALTWALFSLIVCVFAVMITWRKSR